MARRNSKDVVVIGVVYPGMKKFLDEYLNSLEQQTFNKFDLLLVNDGLNDLDNYLVNKNLNCLSILAGGSISDNRRVLICKALEMGYSKIVFTDTDDTFEENRIELVSNLLDKESIVINDLDITDPQGNVNINGYFSDRFNESRMITMNCVLNGNMMGLSNTAARADAIQNSPALKTGELDAFDWYLWSLVLCTGSEARFTSETSTRYRIYDNNMAGLPQLLDKGNVSKGLKVKSQHYNVMSQFHSKYKKLAGEFSSLKNKFNDNNWAAEYICALNKHAIKNHMWWENIRIASEVGII